MIVLVDRPDFGVTVWAGEIKNEQPTVINLGSNGYNRRWKFEDDGRIVLAYNPNYALTVFLDIIQNEQKVIIYAGDAVQRNNKWRVEADGRIVLVHNPEFCLTVFLDIIRNGQDLIIHKTYDAHRNNKWKYTDPYAPKRGSGAWVPMHSVHEGGEITETFGTTKTSTETKTRTWSQSVTATLSQSMSAGVGFKGVGIGVETGIEISGTISRGAAASASESWSQSRTSTYKLDVKANGFLWQWEIRTELVNREVVMSFTKSFAITEGQWERPRCVPGFQTDGLAHQTCHSAASTLF